MTREELDEIDGAGAAHLRWLRDLRAAIRDGASALDPAVVRREDACPFGRWLHRSSPPELHDSPLFHDIRKTHAQFHVQAAAILHLALAGDRSGAEAMLEPGSEFLALSGWLLVRLRSLARLAAELAERPADRATPSGGRAAPDASWDGGRTTAAGATRNARAGRDPE